MKRENRGWQRVLLIIIPFILIVGTFQFIGLLIAGVDYKNDDLVKTSEQHLIIAFFGLLGTFFLLWLFMKFVDKEKFANLGFHIKNKLKEFNLGFIIGAIIMIIGYLLLLFMNEIQFKEIVFNPKEIIISIFVYSIVAVVEEALFRGYVLRNLMLSFNKYIALIVTSLLFALLHLVNPNINIFSFFNLFLAGILLGTSYIFTKNLWFPIALHFSWNLFQTLLGFNVSGQDFYSFVEFEIVKNNLLNGGEFGFEGSILSIIAEVFFIIVIWVYYNNRQLNNL
jgi:membrane protease YdiL (CAAX protease family)